MPFTYHYRPVNRDDLPWQSRAKKPYGTIGHARAAGATWANAMANEGCPVEFKVVELVSDGRGGLVAKEDSK
jgi:hypothetical protein